DVELISICERIELVLSLLVFSWCNYLAHDDKAANNFGLNVNRARLLISIVAVLLASIATSIAGMFAFVGLLVPHLGRQLVGTDHKYLILFSKICVAALIFIAV